MHGQTLNTLHTFGDSRLGMRPDSGVIVGSHGELYGTTALGGASGLGVAYELVPPAQPGGTWTYVVLHSFSTKNGDGHPVAGVVTRVWSSESRATHGVNHRRNRHPAAKSPPQPGSRILCA
jgi:hypothetical protein